MAAQLVATNTAANVHVLGTASVVEFVHTAFENMEGGGDPPAAGALASGPGGENPRNGGTWCRSTHQL